MAPVILTRQCILVISFVAPAQAQLTAVDVQTIITQATTRDHHLAQ